MADEISCKTIKDLQRFFTDKLDSLATKDYISGYINDLTSIINNQNKIIEAQNTRISALENKIDCLESSLKVTQACNTALENEVDTKTKEILKNQEETEQYSRRLCLRIYGIKCEDNESAEVCLQKCVKVFEELGVSIPNVCIDRAHRVGKAIFKDGLKKQPMIVKFTTWRHRTEVFRARKKLKDYTIYLDLTRERLSLLKEARKYIEGNSSCEYAFADVNCRLSLRFKDGSLKYFSDLEALKSLL